MSDYTYTAATIKALTVAEAKAHLGVTHTEDDSLIADYIDAATAALEARASRCFVEQTRKLEMSGFDDSRYVRDRKIYLPRSPLNSVTNIVYTSASNVSTTLPSSDYIVSTHDKPGRISEASGATWPDTYGVENDVVVTYLTGSSTSTASVPANIKQAIRMLVGHWYRNREQVMVGVVSKEVEWGIDALMESEVVENYT